MITHTASRVQGKENFADNIQLFLGGLFTKIKGTQTVRHKAEANYWFQYNTWWHGKGSKFSNSMNSTTVNIQL